MPTATFRILYVFLVLEHERRRIVHFNVTEGPSARWTVQQLVNAFPYDSAPKYVIRDRDKIYGAGFVRRVRAMGIEQVLTAPHSPWQNPYCERVIGTLRRDCLDHVIVVGENHLRRILRKYLEYYHGSRTHLALGKDAPEPCKRESIDGGKVAALPQELVYSSLSKCPNGSSIQSRRIRCILAACPPSRMRWSNVAPTSMTLRTAS